MPEIGWKNVMKASSQVEEHPIPYGSANYTFDYKHTDGRHLRKTQKTEAESLQ